MSEPTTKGWAPPGRPAAVLFYAWFGAVSMYGLLQVCLPDGILRGDLPWRIRVSLFAAEYALGQAWCLPVAALVLFTLRTRGLWRAPAVAGLIGLLVGAGLSWGQFWKTGCFAGVGSLRMAALNPVPLLEHALHFHPVITVLFPLWVAGAAGALLAFSHWAARRDFLRGRALVLGWLAILLAGANACVAAFTPGSLPFKSTEPHNLGGAGLVSSLGGRLYDVFSRKNGPFSALAADLFLHSDMPPVVDERIPVDWKPIISPADYAAKIDPGRIKRHNVLLILVESLRADELRLGGSPRSVMPAVDALAEEAAFFTRHYSTASHSNYADLAPLSSHYPLRSPVTHVYPASPTYPRVLIYDVLKAQGWRTGVVSSQNENWGAMANYLRTPGLDVLWHSENFEGETYVSAGDLGFARMRKKSGKVDDRLTVDRAIRWMDEGPGAPFFLYLNLQNSHFPFEVGAGFSRPFGPDSIDFEPNFTYLKQEEVPVMRARYRDSLAYCDAQLARLFEHLRRTGRWEDTLVVLSGDTGQAFMEHGFSGHANRLFDEVLRTPLVMRVPGRPAETTNRLAQHVDVPPTVLAALGFPPHPSFQGEDLFAPPRGNHRDVFLTAQTPLAEQYGLVRGDYKYLELPFSGEASLFNLCEDPGETTNLARSRPDLAGELKRRLDTWRASQLGYYRDLDRHLAFYPPVVGADER